MPQGAMPQTEIGQRYKKVGLPSQVWEVEIERATNFDTTHHFLLRSMEDPLRTILVSEKALRNPRLFQPAETHEPESPDRGMGSYFRHIGSRAAWQSATQRLLKSHHRADALRPGVHRAIDDCAHVAGLHHVHWTRLAKGGKLGR